MKEENKLSLSKYLLLFNVLNDDNLKKIYNKYDELVLKKRFNTIKELSTTENILTIEENNLKYKDINKIIDDFIKKSRNKNFLEKRNIYEIIKISKLSKLKINRAISENKLLKIENIIRSIYIRTNYISFDFLILKIIDNLATKLNNPIIRNKYKALKKDIFRKLITFNEYNLEVREKQTSYLCWIDRTLTAALNYEITVSDFITLNNKIIKLVPNHLDTDWKVVNVVGYLSFQPNFSTCTSLRKFKRDLLKSIKNKYNAQYFTKENVEDLMVTTLSKQFPQKEDFYYLFDAIDLLFQKSEEEKIFCLNLCNYILYINNKQNVFCYRFIRESFLNMISKIIKFENSSVIIEEELRFILRLFNNTSFFYLNKKDLFHDIVYLLSKLNINKGDISRCKFYKYCDMLDYILSNNYDLFYPGLIRNISSSQDDVVKIQKRFQLCGKMLFDLFSNTKTTEYIIQNF